MDTSPQNNSVLLSEMRATGLEQASNAMAGALAEALPAVTAAVTNSVAGECAGGEEEGAMGWGGQGGPTGQGARLEPSAGTPRP